VSNEMKILAVQPTRRSRMRFANISTVSWASRPSPDSVMVRFYFQILENVRGAEVFILQPTVRRWIRISSSCF